jgi:hypothetical protein
VSTTTGSNGVTLPLDDFAICSLVHNKMRSGASSLDGLNPGIEGDIKPYVEVRVIGIVV